MAEPWAPLSLFSCMYACSVSFPHICTHTDSESELKGAAITVAIAILTTALLIEVALLTAGQPPNCCACCVPRTRVALLDDEEHKPALSRSESKM